MAEYILPDPKVRPDVYVVLSYKTLKGINYDDKNWDKVHFGRCLKSAKILLGVCGGLRQADSCIVEISKKFEDANLDWTLETILKHAHDWITKKRGPNENSHRSRLFKALTERSGVEESNGLIKTGESIFDSFRMLEAPRQGNQKDSDDRRGIEDGRSVDKLLPSE